MAWINLSDEMEFTDEAYEDFFPGMMMVFDYEGSKTYMKVRRIDKKQKKMWVEEAHTYSPAEFEKKFGVEIKERES